MKCIDDGILRALLDGELSGTEFAQGPINTSPRAPIAKLVSKS